MSNDALTDFEAHMMKLEPECDLIYRNNYDDDYESIKNRKYKTGIDYWGLGSSTSNTPTKLPTKNFHEVIFKKKLGELPCDADWDDSTNKEKEVIAMMRSCGIESSADENLRSDLTLATPSSGKEVIWNGNFPIFLDEKFFKLKPRNPTPKETSTNGSPLDNSTKEPWTNSSPLDDSFESAESFVDAESTVSADSTSDSFKSAV